MSEVVKKRFLVEIYDNVVDCVPTPTNPICPPKTKVYIMTPKKRKVIVSFEYWSAYDPFIDLLHFLFDSATSVRTLTIEAANPQKHLVTISKEKFDEFMKMYREIKARPREEVIILF